MNTASIQLTRDQINELVATLKTAPITGNVDRAALFWVLAGGLTDLDKAEATEPAPVDPALFEEYQSDFDNMTDEEVEHETNMELNNLDRAEEWIEAVAAWKAAGKPRNKEEVAA